jgi:ATP-dependent RNA helicase RhlE
LLNQPQLIEVARRNTAAESVVQTAYKVPQDAKRALLEHIVRSRNVWQVLCFVRTKHGASRLARQLEKDGLATSAIHGDKTQAARLEALSAFKEGKLQVLVATDVAARGLDIEDMPLVVNYELPHVPEDYIHRIGRTGRAGATGEAMSFVAPEEEKYLVEIEKLLRKKVAIAVAEGFDPSVVRSERPVRSPHDKLAPSAREPREPRTPREPRLPRAQGASRERVPTADERLAERELAYARNPDQPATSASGGAARSQSALMHRQPPHGHGNTKRPVPALLMKRPAPEPEKV